MERDNPNARLEAFATRKAHVENALNSMGTSSEVIEGNVRESVQVAAAFAGDVVSRTAGQAMHNQLTNIPCGIMRSMDVSANTALRQALPGAIGALVEWNIGEALKLCAGILEDVNAHDEAAQVLAMRENISRYYQAPADTEDCPTCNGTGYTREQECRNCKGTGTVIA